MTFTEFRENLLIGLYQDDSLSGDWHDLSEIQSKYGLQGDMKLLSLAAKHLAADGNIDLRELVGAAIRGRLTGAGISYIEQKYGDKDGVGTILQPADDFEHDHEMVGLPSLISDPSIEYKSEFALRPHDAVLINKASEPHMTSRPPTVDSSTWTGKQFKLVDAKIIAEVKISAEQLRNAVHATRFESNSDSQNLKSLADALVAICGMAEPEITIIDRILANPKFQAYAGLANLIATIRGVLGI